MDWVGRRVRVTKAFLISRGHAKHFTELTVGTVIRHDARVPDAVHVRWDERKSLHFWHTRNLEIIEGNDNADV